MPLVAKRDSIYIQKWLGFHPYEKPEQSDFYYLRISNEIYDLLRDDDFPDEEIALSREQKKDFACFIGCYFEDVISGPGLWKAFISQFSELYRTYLPFFEPDPEEYYPDEINREDIDFLLWYYLSMVLRDESIISPSICEWTDQSAMILEILEREYEVAPENPRLSRFLQVKPLEDDFYVIRKKLKWIILDSWLHHFMGKELKEIITDVISGDGVEPLPEESRALYLYDTIDTFVLTRHTPLLAKQGKEWLAKVLGKDHPLYKSLLEMGEKKNGFYLFLGTEGDDLLFRHIATGTELTVTSKSMEVPAGTQPGRSIYSGGFVNWKGEWWFTGAQLGWEYDYELIRKERESEESKMLFGKNPEVQREENRQVFPSFLKFNHGKPLAFVEDINTAKRFIQDFLAFHNRSLGKRRRMKEPDLNFVKEIPGVDAGPNKIDKIPGMIYCDPDTGIDLAFGYNDYIPDPRNKWFKEDNTEEVRSDGTMRMLESLYINGNWMKYLASNYDLPGLDFPGLGGRELLVDNLDFMLRFWKREKYYG